MNLLAYILTSLLFVGPVILAVVGWPVEGDFKSVYLYPSFYILIVFVLVAFTKGNLKEKKYKYAVWILMVTIVWFLLNKVMGRSNSTMILFNSMALPAMYYIFYELLKNGLLNRKIIRNLILLFFTINCLVAIYERLTMHLYFPFDLIRTDFDLDMIQEEMVFRSSALLGHPLTNALFMAIIMIFILVSDIRPLKKYLLYIIGFFSLFCFNARAAIMISAGTFALYASRPLFRRGTSFSKKFFSVVLLFAFGAIGFYLLSAGYGGRFEEQGDFSEDNSTLARIEVWSIFSRYGVTNFLWGMSGKDVEKIAIAVMGITHIENWFILSTMVVGLVVTTIVTLLFIPLYRSAQKMYDRFTSFLLFVVVVGLSSTNNSLACGVQALSLFFACCYAFPQLAIEKETNNCVVIEDETEMA